MEIDEFSRNNAHPVWTLWYPSVNFSLRLTVFRFTIENPYPQAIRSHSGISIMAESSKKLRHDNYLKAHLRIMIWIGLNRPLHTHRIINILFMVRMIFIITTYAALMFGCAAHMKIVNEYDLLASSMNVLQLTVYSIGILHAAYFGIRNEAVHCLVKKVQKAFRFASNTGHFTMEEPARVDKLKSFGWAAVCVIAVVCWFALAIAKGDDPIPIWAPVDLQKSPYYEIDTIIQFTGQFMMGMHGGYFGSFYISVLSLFGYQFDLLSCSLEHVAPLAVLNTRRRVHHGNEKTPSTISPKGYTSNREGDEREISHRCECCTLEVKRFFASFEKRRFENTLTRLEMRVYEEELHDALKDCIVHHRNIVELKDAVEDFFGPVMLIRFSLSAMMLCFTTYGLSKITAKDDFSPTDMRFMGLVEYYVVAVGEMFIFCHIADCLLRKSMRIPNVAFEKIPWHGGCVTKKLISILKIFHLIATNPTCLRTPFYVVSLTILSAILRASFSFYTLLRRLQSD